MRGLSTLSILNSMSQEKTPRNKKIFKFWKKGLTYGQIAQLTPTLDKELKKPLSKVCVFYIVQRELEREKTRKVKSK